MDRARSRRLLLLAFAISLLLHFAGFPFLKWRPAPQDEVERTSKVRVIRIARAVQTPPPTPPPTPAPTPRRAAVKQHPATRPLSVPRVRSTSGKASLPAPAPGPIVATGISAATPAPAPSAVPSATPCAGRTIAPQVLQAPSPPPIPSEARRAATEGTAAVDVNVDAAGRVQTASVRNSTGNPGLDAIAERMARDATYAPATADCKKAAGVATFTVQFWVI